MSRGAFTLIEVLVSVTILAVVATGLFQISLNSKNNFEFLYKKAAFDRKSSIPLMHNDPKYHHKEKEFYEFLRGSYDIKDDEIRQYLKKEKISYSQEEYTTFSPLGDNIQDNTDFEQNQNPMAQSIRLIFDKVAISNKNQSTYAYKIRIQ